MKPQQLSIELGVVEDALNTLKSGVRQVGAALPAALPTIAAIAVALASSIVLTLSGCASSAGISSDAKIVAPTSVGIDTSAPAMPQVAADWWRGFGDTTLTNLVEQAMAGNPTLKVAQARLTRAEAAVSGAKSADGPQVNGSVDITRQRYSA